jgi:hypothetical protein
VSTLFEFNTSAIDLLSGSGITAQLDDARNRIEREIRDELAARSPGVDYDLSWEGDQIVVALNEEQAGGEFGGPTQALNPAVRTSLLAAVENLRSRLVIRD